MRGQTPDPVLRMRIWYGSKFEFIRGVPGKANMTSCEPLRSSAYSEDMRWRIVWQSQGLGIPCKDIATNLNIDISTVKRVVCLFSNTGDVCKRPYPSERAYRKINETVQHFILYLVLGRPGIYLREIVSELSAVLDLDVTESAVCKFLKKVGFTHHKLATFALQRDDTLRKQFVSDVSLYQRDTLLFVDETGTDGRDTVRKYGYSLRGKPLKAQKLLVRGEHISCIAAMSVQGIEAIKIARGSVDGDAFYSFVCTSLFTKVMPFNGTNPNSVLILDNCSVHHVDEVRQALGDCGVLTHFLPPYSPDYNPIELAFSKVKYAIKSMEAEMQAINDLETIVLAAFATITSADCQSWINSIGIY